MSTPTPEQIAKVARNLPSAEADPNTWDDSKIEERWAGIAGTIRAHWYEKVSETAGYLDIEGLPITQIHRQAKEMLTYWDTFIALWGPNADPDVVEGKNRPTTFGRVKGRGVRRGQPGLIDYPYRSPYSRA